MAKDSDIAPAIFISYRRRDEPYAALLLCRELQLAFGGDQVFLDVTLEHGDAFPERISRALAGARLVLAVIGPRWLAERDQHDRRRIDDERDWVRRELRYALRRDRHVLPVLVNGATRPARDALPRDLQSLSDILDRAVTVEGWTERQRDVLLDRVAELTRLVRREDGELPLSSAQLPERYFAAIARRHQRLLGLFARYETSEVYVEPQIGPESGSVSREEFGASPTLASLLAAASRGTTAKRWLVLGEPVSGKSTALRKTCIDLARRGDPSEVPVFVALPAWMRDRDRSLWQHAAERSGLPETDRDEAARWLQARHAEGAIRLLLDGFDEVAPEQQHAALDRLDPLLATDSIAIVTSRPIGKGSIVERLKPGLARMQGFDETRQLDLLSKRLGADSATAVFAAIRARPALARLAPNPLLLSLIAWLAAKDPQSPLPDRAQDLHDRIVDEVLKVGWKEGDEGERAGIAEWHLASEILVELAFHLQQCRGDDTVWSEGEVLEALNSLPEPIGRCLRDCREWTGVQGFVAALARTGLLSEAEGPGEGYRFLHRTLGESLASRALVARAADATRRPEVIQLAGSIAGQEGRWAETFALFAGRTPDAAKWLRALKSANPVLARRAMAFVDALDVDTVADVLELPGDDLDARCQLFLRVPELVGDPRGAARVLGRLAAVKTDTQELWHIASALDELKAAAEAREDEGVAAEVEAVLAKQLFAALPPSPGRGILEWCEVAADTRFVMGGSRDDSESSDDERPQHEVTIARRFAIAKTSVTNAMWKLFRPDHAEHAAPGGRDAPVVEVSWYDAAMFCRWIGARLPSEAEWECACRAGTTTRFSFGDRESDLTRHAWFDKNSRGTPHPVSQKAANPWGLFDMHGNVWEWCEDAWQDGYEGAPADGSARVDRGSADRVFRGGSWFDSAWWCRSSYRFGGPAVVRGAVLGFRPASSSLP